MKTPSRWFVIILLAGLLLAIQAAQGASADAEFPQKNAWFRATPSVVWCGDPNSPTTLEIHIVGRTDVARVWITDLQNGFSEEERMLELFDDGTHGDQTAGDNTFTHSEVVIPCRLGPWIKTHGWSNWGGFLRVELTNGTRMGNNYNRSVGLVDSSYRNDFEVTELAPGITATAYGVFIEDIDHEVFSDYPVADVTCGKSNFEAYRKLYSVFGDDFDFASVMPGRQLFKPDGFGENVPYNVSVKNEVQHIGMNIMDNTAKFGSAGQLKSVTYQSFGALAIFDHEIAHTWGAAIGQSLGLLSDIYTSDVHQGHWNEYADMEGQLGLFYTEGSATGHFSFRTDGSWRLIRNTVAEPYSPLELYIMGLIPPEEVPPIHILNNPDLSSLTSITADSYKTVTIEEVIAAEGGARIPSHEDSQKDFTLAFIVAQDHSYTDAAYAYFSLMSYQLTSKEGPSEYQKYLAPFYWATGGRASIETKLPLDLDYPQLPGMPAPEEEAEDPAPDDGAAPEENAAPDEADPEEEPAPANQDPEQEDTAPEKAPTCSLLPAGIVIALPLLFTRRRKREE